MKYLLYGLCVALVAVAVSLIFWDIHMERIGSMAY